MPYNTNEELTNKVPGTDKLSPRKQRQFRHVWNYAKENGDSEETCYQKAWGTVKNTASGFGNITGVPISEGNLSDNVLCKDLLDSMDELVSHDLNVLGV